MCLIIETNGLSIAQRKVMDQPSKIAFCAIDEDCVWWKKQTLKVGLERVSSRAACCFLTVCFNEETRYFHLIIFIQFRTQQRRIFFSIFLFISLVSQLVSRPYLFDLFQSVKTIDCLKKKKKEKRRTTCLHFLPL